MTAGTWWVWRGGGGGGGGRGGGLVECLSISRRGGKAGPHTMRGTAKKRGEEGWQMDPGG